MKFARTLPQTLIGSDILIITACILHILEATIFLTTTVADGSTGMASLLAVFRFPILAAITMYAASGMAITGQYLSKLSCVARLILLLPQQTLLIITAIGAVIAISHGMYLDGVQRPWSFILCDQFPRLTSPILYSAAILARVRPRHIS